MDEERNWAQELENERDQLKNRLESEIVAKEKLMSKRDRDLENLSDKIKDLEEQIFKKDNSLQQLKKEIVEKDKIVEEKNLLLEEKNRAYEEVSLVAEKRKKQVGHLRLSLKSRDDALTDLNNKNRSLLSQFDSSFSKVSSSSVSSAHSVDESHYGGKTFGLCSSNRSYSYLDLEPDSDRAKLKDFYSNLDRKESLEIKKVHIFL